MGHVLAEYWYIKDWQFSETLASQGNYLGQIDVQCLMKFFKI